MVASGEAGFDGKVKKNNGEERRRTGEKKDMVDFSKINCVFLFVINRVNTHVFLIRVNPQLLSPLFKKFDFFKKKEIFPRPFLSVAHSLWLLEQHFLDDQLFPAPDLCLALRLPP